MPFYEYECSACKYYVEALQKISDPPMVKCPSCGQNTLQRLVSAPVFRLKGSGWYETDFKSDKEPKRNIATDAEPTASDKKEGEDAKTLARARKKALDAAKATSTAKSAQKLATKPVKKAPKKAAKQPSGKAAAKKAPVKTPVKKKSASKKKVAVKVANKAAKKAGKRKAAKKK